MQLLIAKRLQSVQPSTTMAMNEKAQELMRDGIKIFNLTAGEPDQPTPEEICQAAEKAMREGYTRYTPVAGYLELRQRLAQVMNERTGVPVEPQEIMVTAGGKQALCNFFMALLNPGDEVLIPSPAWVSFPEMVRLAGGISRIVTTHEKNGYFPSVEELEACRTDRTRALVLNTPNNPTGQILDASSQDILVRWCVEHGIYVVYDETYAELTFPEYSHVHPLRTFPDALPWVITVDSFSKTFRMTGWRIGWVYAIAPWINTMTVIQSHSTSNACSISQRAALTALDLPREFLDGPRTLYALRAQRFLEGLRSIPGLHPIQPQGAFYVWVNVSAWQSILQMNDQELALHILEHAHVATVPGSAFQSPGFIRFSVAADEDTLEQSFQSLNVYAQRFITPFMETRS